MKAAELAHTRHTSTSFRIGFGEVCSAQLKRLSARVHFLGTVSALCPVVLADLQLIYERHRSFPFQRWMYEPSKPAILGEVEDWCVRHGLTFDGTPADWVVSTAFNTLHQWKARGWPGWAYPSAAAGPLTEREERAIVGTQYWWDPELTGMAAAKRSIPKRYWPELNAILKIAHSRGGVKSEWKCEPEHVEWAVLRRVQGCKWREIAARYNRAEETVRHYAIPYLKLIGLNLPKGRPRKH